MAIQGSGITTIDEVKNKLHSHVGDTVTIKYNMGRNKFEKYNGTIKELYDYVFLFEIEHPLVNEIKSFSYSDVITKTVKIDIH